MMLSQADHSWISSTKAYAQRQPGFTLSGVVDLPLIDSPGYAPTGSDQTYQNGGATSPVAFSAHLRRYAAPCFPALRLRLSPIADLRQRQQRTNSATWMRRNHKLTVGFIHIGSNFRQKFYRRDTGRGGQLKLVKNGLANLFRDQRRRALAVNAIADVEIRLIQRQRFN